MVSGLVLEKELISQSFRGGGRGRGEGVEGAWGAVWGLGLLGAVGGAVLGPTAVLGAAPTPDEALPVTPCGIGLGDASQAVGEGSAGRVSIRTVRVPRGMDAASGWGLGLVAA